jgi:hypothetical protein
LTALLWLIAPAAWADAPAPAGEVPAWEVEAAAADAFDRATAGVKAALVLATLILVGHRALRARAGKDRRHERGYRTALAVLAVLSFASYYKFSASDRIEHDVHLWDVYHYYIGAKYFPELGYSRIYECTLAAADEDGWELLDEIDWVRDLRSMTNWRASVVLSGSRECRPSFTPERWEAFKRDLAWFDERLPSRKWRVILVDHGYNATPVWTLLGRGIAAVIPVDALVLAVHVDMLLVVLSLAAIGWAFGFQALCLATIVWGSGFLWRWIWIGDAYLRFAWFASSIVGLCCLRRGLDFLAGVSLSLSALLRLFPLAFAGGYGLHALRQTWRNRQLARTHVRFALGFALGVVVLTTAGAVVSGRGTDAYVSFWNNTAVYRDVPASNKAGAPALLWRLDGTLEHELTGEEPERTWLSPAASRAAGWLLIAAFLGLYLRAVRHVEGWEAAAMSFALIPVLAAPAGYYFSFVLSAIMLSTRRPRIAIWLLAACLFWLLNGIRYHALEEIPTQFTGVSIVSLLLSAAVLVEMARPAEIEANGTTG